MAKPSLSPVPAQLSQDELAFLRAKADRVILLLDTSVMPDEVKTSWLTLLPHMTLDQVDRLTSLLEEELALTLKYAKQRPEDEELVLKLKAAKERYDGSVAEADKRALLQIARIEEDLNAVTAGRTSIGA